MEEGSSTCRDDYGCIVSVLADRDKKYAGQWVVVADGRVAHHGTDRDKMIQKVRAIQDNGKAPLVHYVSEKEPEAFLL